ncbi:potassium channel family protein [Streptomyces sp. NBC_01497]|uniref:potassium channel family protein n=1 Tax=Streptomyces sp. NBC_01497 TaxID=2903885 RepID=UPI002E34ABF2|nr:potassium channel family protein [Streptomyces sp. NBC_01497]
MRDETGPSRLGRWEEHVELPLFAMSFVYLGGYTVWVLAWQAAAVWRDVGLTVMLAAWAVFAGDYAVRLVLSGEGRRFVRSHWLDSLVLLLPLLRPLRLVKLYTTVQHRRSDQPWMNLYARVITYAGLASVLLAFTAALTVYQAERGAPGATIRTFGDSLWWAASTITTVGYGDAVPITAEGRLVAVGLMSCGLALLGAVTGSFSSWVIEIFRRESRDAPRPPER